MKLLVLVNVCFVVSLVDAAATVRYNQVFQALTNQSPGNKIHLSNVGRLATLWSLIKTDAVKKSTQSGTSDESVRLVDPTKSQQVSQDKQLSSFTSAPLQNFTKKDMIKLEVLVGEMFLTIIDFEFDVILNNSNYDQFELNNLISMYIYLCPDYTVFQDRAETSGQTHTSYPYYYTEKAASICNSIKHKIYRALSNIEQTEQEFITMCNDLIQLSIDLKVSPNFTQRLATLSAERGLWKALQHLLRSGARLTHDIVEMSSWKRFMGIEDTDRMYGNLLKSNIFRSYPDKLKHVLQYACVEGNQKLITYLIDSGLSLNSTSLGIGFIWNALTRHNLQLVDFLVHEGADVSGKNDQGLTLLHLSALLDQDTDILQYLLDKGLDINVLSDTGLTALDVSHGHSYSFLISRGALTAQQHKLIRENSEDPNDSTQSQNPREMSHHYTVLQV